MSENNRDQVARDMAAKAIAAIERHEAVCSEAEKRRAQQIKDMDDNLRGWLERIQKAYDQAWADISSRHSNAMVIVNGNTNKFFEDQKTVNKELRDKFWLLLWAYAGGMTAFAAAMLWYIITTLLHHG